MGLTAVFLAELLELKRADAIPGRRMIEIGAHQLSNFFLRAVAELNEIYRLFDATYVSLGSETDRNAPDWLEMIRPTSPMSERFWRSLGFSYTAIEFEGRHGVMSFDLNTDPIPAAMLGAYDLLVNAGTTEHVFNQDHAFRVMHDLVAPGGIMMHTGPATGWAMHGLYQYSPKFFWKLCDSNDYEILRLQLFPWRSRPIPSQIIDSNAKWGSARYPPLPAELMEVGYVAILRKRNDLKFRIPIDV